jgi:Fibronectin type III domain
MKRLGPQMFRFFLFIIFSPFLTFAFGVENGFCEPNAAPGISILLLLEEQPALPPMAPRNLRVVSDGAKAVSSAVTLAWDANNEPDLAGYRVYYNAGSSGPPYVGTGADQGNSPINVPLESFGDPGNPSFTINGLDEGETWYFAVTAYNAVMESGFSNEVSMAFP